ncbi:13544_t:CDS:2, partial [Entrophospora sp. SA101]
TQIDDAHKVAILKSKLGRKYADLPNQHAGNAIDTPARFIAWLRHKYQTETVGTQQVALQRLAYEKFLPNDTPEAYETRIRPLLLGVANDDANALSFLMNHLPDDLFNRMESANPGNINYEWNGIPTTSANSSTTHIPTASANCSTTYISTASTNRSTTVLQPPQQIVQPPPQFIQKMPPVYDYQRNFCPKTEKAKYYEELRNYADIGLEAEDNRVLEPIEIDYAIINIASKLDQLEGLSTTPNSSINLARGPRVSTKPIQRKCEICKKLGHTYRSCPIIKNMMANNSKKKVGRVNFADGFQQSHSDTEELPDEFISDKEEDNISDEDSNQIPKRSKEKKDAYPSEGKEIQVSPQVSQNPTSTLLERRIREIIQSELINSTLLEEAI